jgi:hypothetical protein
MMVSGRLIQACRSFFDGCRFSVLSQSATGLKSAGWVAANAASGF